MTITVFKGHTDADEHWPARAHTHTHTLLACRHNLIWISLFVLLFLNRLWRLASNDWQVSPKQHRTEGKNRPERIWHSKPLFSSFVLSLNLIEWFFFFFFSREFILIAAVIHHKPRKWTALKCGSFGWGVKFPFSANLSQLVTQIKSQEHVSHQPAPAKH